MAQHTSNLRKLISESFSNLFPGVPYAEPENKVAVDLAVEVKNLAVSIRPKSLPVFSNVNFEIPVQCRTALIGPNGSGKSTLLRTLAGLIPHYTGDVKLFGSQPRLGRSRIAYLAQSPQLNPDFPLQLKRLVQMGTYAHHGWFEECHHADEKVASALKLLELEDLVDRSVHNLSGGQLQRGLLARAAVQGAGRLIRSETDRGILVVCDIRMGQSGYGKQLLQGLPPMRRLADGEAWLEALADLGAERELRA